MTFPAPHYYLTFGGSAYTTEIWQCGIRAIPDTSTDTFAADLAAWPAGVEAPLKTWFGAAANRFQNTHKIEWAKAAAVGIDGKYVGPNTMVEKVFASPQAGGVTTDHQPPQCGVVVTLTTAIPRGYASKGRMFMPTQAVSLTDGRITSSMMTALGTATTQLLNALNTGLPGSLAVYSSVGTGAVNPITGFRVGNMVDTQQRRRAGLSEVYTSTAWS